MLASMAEREESQTKFKSEEFVNSVILKLPATMCSALRDSWIR